MITSKGILVVHLISLTFGIIHARSVNREIIDLAKRIRDEYDIHNPDHEVLFNLLGLDALNQKSDEELFDTEPDEAKFFREPLKNKNSPKIALIEAPKNKIKNYNQNLKKGSSLSKSSKEIKNESSINAMNKIRKYVKKPVIKKTATNTNKKNIVTYKDKYFWKKFWSKLSKYEKIKKMNQLNLNSNGEQKLKDKAVVITNNKIYKFKDNTMKTDNDNFEQVIDDDILYENLDLGSVDHNLIENYGDIDYYDGMEKNKANIIEGELNEKNVIADLISHGIKIQDDISIIDGDDFDTKLGEKNGDDIGADGEFEDTESRGVSNNQEDDSLADYINESNNFEDEKITDNRNEKSERDAKFNDEIIDNENVDIANFLGKNIGKEELSEEEFEDESNLFYDNRDNSGFKLYRVEKNMEKDRPNEAEEENGNITEEIKDVDTNNEMAGNDETFVAPRDLSEAIKQYHEGFVDQDDIFADYIKGRNLLSNQKSSQNTNDQLELNKEINDEGDERANIENVDIANFLGNSVNNEEEIGEEEFEDESNLFYDNKDTNSFKLYRIENKLNDRKNEMENHDNVNEVEEDNSRLNRKNYDEDINNKSNEVENDLKDFYVDDRDVEVRGIIDKIDKTFKVKIENKRNNKEGFEQDDSDNDSERFYEDDDNNNENQMDEDFGVMDYLEDIKLKGELDEANRKLYEDLEDEDHAVMDYIEDDGIDVSDY